MGSLNTGHGVIATLVRDGRLLVRHFPADARVVGRTLQPGSGSLDAIRDLVAFCDAGGWKVQTISTPNTILRDLQGLREYANAQQRGGTTPRPEQKALGSRSDLLADPPHRETTAASPWVDPHRRRRGRGPRA